ncbi:MAG: response regulator [Verrucomicrobia bacterium]|nr:response regulator [Verrucomicrobiota bacterium]
MNPLKALFSSSGFMPHGFCYVWDPYVIWLNAAADGLIALAYYTIPIALVYFVRRRKDLVFNWIFLGFALFIVACGTTHVMEVISIWRPMYWLVGAVKAVTALASIGTAVALIGLIPQALRLPSPRELRATNQALQEAQDALRKTNEELELRIADRTASLAAANRTLLAEIEERRRTDEQLRESERQLRTAIARSPIPVIIYDEEGIVRFLSQGWTDYSGYTLQDIPTLGQWTLKAYGENSGVARAHIDELFTISDTVYEGEWTIRAKDQNQRIWEFRTIPLGRDRSSKRLLMSQAVDITERKEADQQKNQFLALLGHELRNPLAPIASALHVIGQTGADPAKVAQVRQMAERQVRHMARLLDDLLDVVRISQGRLELRPKPIEIGAALESAVESARPLCNERGHQITLVHPAQPLWVRADSTRLEQVLTNLLNNAAKYTDPGGRIQVSGDAEGAEAVIRVRDSGIGIAPAMLPRIFDLFVQGERRLNHSVGGVGIGLSLVKQLIEAHGGRVDALSAGVGKGSEFIVRLPILKLDPAHGTGAEPAAPIDPDTAGPVSLRVMVVDDNSDAADSLAAVLELRGHQARVAYDGPSALAVAQAFRPQVALLDLGLPGMDGYEVARRLREAPETKGIWLAAVTGWGQAADRRRSTETGFDCHLVKPVQPAVLEHLLAQVAAATHPRAEESARGAS